MTEPALAKNIRYAKVRQTNDCKRQQTPEMTDTTKYDADLGSVCAFCDEQASKKIQGRNVCDDQFCRYLAWATPTSHEDDE